MSSWKASGAEAAKLCLSAAKILLSAAPNETESVWRASLRVRSIPSWALGRLSAPASRSSKGQESMNDSFRQLKERMRQLDAVLLRQGANEDIDFAQAVSSLHRAARRGDRSREPTPELMSLLERAESFGRKAG